MKPAVIAAGVLSLIWLIWRKSTDPDYCCPCCGWEGEDDELNYIPATPWDESKLNALLGGHE